ncbi:hypothetical protein NE237_026626 [Protea cynaroides]|uniref:Protein-S-isoprenylcysteine O-methyltransferase n=1 Tax=Protea cynaroides TaxID=273540 RepID=A0A9Q0H7G5_9MAGN|nr:hypothetical protein NE237_026626 [Protea cynaroides]
MSFTNIEDILAASSPLGVFSPQSAISVNPSNVVVSTTPDSSPAPAWSASPGPAPDVSPSPQSSQSLTALLIILIAIGFAILLALIVLIIRFRKFIKLAIVHASEPKPIFYFHSSEYILAIAIHGRFNVTLSSLLISKEYLLAMTCSLLEYIIELVLLPELKEYWWVSNTGLVLTVIGEIIRKSAVLTAGRSFTHMIRIRRDDQKELVTHGIYRFIRHPGYCGFFIWAIGIQLMLCNPSCTVGFVLVLWHFFSERIHYEEYYLRKFFGSQYVEYSRRVRSGLPFVK